MIDKAVGRMRALNAAQRGLAFAVEIVDHMTIEQEFGWVFFYRKAEAPHELAGNAPLIVDRFSGNVTVTGTAYPIDWFIDAYRRLGQERFDKGEWREFIAREYLSRSPMDD